MAKETPVAVLIAGLDPAAVIIPALVDFQDPTLPNGWDRSDPVTGYEAQERATSTGKVSRWDNLAGKTVQIVKVTDGTSKVYAKEKLLAGITGPTYPRSLWSDGIYVYEVPA